MLKKILIVVVIFLIVIAGGYFYLINPNDAQYKASEAEMIALKAYSKGDFETFVKYMNNTTTVKYHAPFILYLTLTNMGRYDEAIKAVNSFEKYIDYGYCSQYKGVMRAACRIADIFAPVQAPYVDKNYYLSRIYLEKGDYKSALEYGLKTKKDSPCHKVKLYAAVNETEKTDKYIKLCEAAYAPNKYKYGLYKTKGYMYLKQKKYDVALDYLNKSIMKVSEKNAKYQGNNASYLLLAQLYEEMNNPAKARYYYELVLKNDPYNYKAQKGVGLIKK